MRGIFAKTWHDLQGGLAGWGVSLLCTAALLICVFPTFAGMKGLQEIIAGSPPALQVLYGRYSDFTTLEGFLGVEGHNLFLPALFLVYVIIAGSALLGAEEERGTLDLLLAYPVPRWRLALEKFAALAVATVVLAAATALGLVAGGLAVGIKADYWRLAAGTMNMVPLTLLFGAIAYFVTCGGWGRGLAGGVAGGLAAIAYLVDSLAPLVKWLDAPSRYLPFYFYGGGLPLKEGVKMGNVAILLAASAILLGLGIWAFQRRDVRV